METRGAKKNWVQDVRRWARVYRLVLIIILAATGFFFGFWGYIEYAMHPPATDPTAGKMSGLDAIYRTVQLFVMNGETIDDPPWQLQLGRYLAPLSTFITAFAAFFEVFGRHTQTLRMRFQRPDVVIFGLGKRGLQLVQDLHQTGKFIVVAECDEKNEQIENCRNLGAAVLIGNAAEISTVERTNAHHAAEVFIVSGDDVTNIIIVDHLYRLHQKIDREARTPLRCKLHLTEPLFCEALESHEMFRNPDTMPTFHVELESTSLIGARLLSCARLLLEKNPLEGDHLGADDPRTVHLVIIGFDRMGQGIALQAAKIGHFANGKKLKLTILDRNILRSGPSFTARYPKLTSICEVEFIPSGFEDESFLKKLKQWASSGEEILSLAICLDQDSNSTCCALTLARQLEFVPVRIHVHVEKKTGLFELLKSDGNVKRFPLLREIRSFGEIGLEGDAPNWSRPEQDYLAEAIHLRYREEKLLEGRPITDPSMLLWEQLVETLKNSNRQAADHIPVKLRGIGCVTRKMAGGGEEFFRFTEEEVELMAKMEHARWCAERFLDGWSEEPLDRPRKKSPYLADWDALPDEIKEWDRVTVRFIPELYNKIGKHIERRTGR